MTAGEDSEGAVRFQLPPAAQPSILYGLNPDDLTDPTQPSSPTQVIEASSPLSSSESTAARVSPPVLAANIDHFDEPPTKIRRIASLPDEGPGAPRAPLDWETSERSLAESSTCTITPEVPHVVRFEAPPPLRQSCPCLSPVTAVSQRHEQPRSSSPRSIPPPPRSPSIPIAIASPPHRPRRRRSSAPSRRGRNGEPFTSTLSTASRPTYPPGHANTLASATRSPAAGLAGYGLLSTKSSSMRPPA